MIFPKIPPHHPKKILQSIIPVNNDLIFKFCLMAVDLFDPLTNYPVKPINQKKLAQEEVIYFTHGSE